MKWKIEKNLKLDIYWVISVDELWSRYRNKIILLLLLNSACCWLTISSMTGVLSNEFRSSKKILSSFCPDVSRFDLAGCLAWSFLYNSSKKSVYLGSVLSGFGITNSSEVSLMSILSFSGRQLQKVTKLYKKKITCGKKKRKRARDHLNSLKAITLQ